MKIEVIHGENTNKALGKELKTPITWRQFKSHAS